MLEKNVGITFNTSITKGLLSYKHELGLRQTNTFRVRVNVKDTCNSINSKLHAHWQYLFLM